MANERPVDGRALRLLRTDAELTQKQLARASGVHNASISAAERGTRPVSPAVQEALVAGLGLPSRVWPAVVGLLRWLDFVRGESAAEPEPDVEAFAEGLGRAVEQSVAAFLRLVRAPGRVPQPEPGTGQANGTGDFAEPTDG